MDYKVNIDLDRVNDTLNTLDTLENVFHQIDFSLAFDDMNQYFRTINFEHGNCLVYKDLLDSIYDDLDYIKRKMYELNITTHEVATSYQNLEELTSDKLKRLLQMYDGTSFKNAILSDINSSDVTVIPNAQPEQTNNDVIDTVPIGIAIGATGIVGSVGAVVVNEMYGQKEKVPKRPEEDHFEEYRVHKDDDYSYSLKNDTYQTTDYFGGEVKPYSANRKEREANRFYGNEETFLDRESEKDDIVLADIHPKKEIDLELDNDDEEDLFDDFYE